MSVLSNRIARLEKASGANGCRTHARHVIPYFTPETAPERMDCHQCGQPLMRIVVVFPQSLVDAGLAVVDPGKSARLGYPSYSPAPGRTRELRGILEERAR